MQKRQSRSSGRNANLTRLEARTAVLAVKESSALAAKRSGSTAGKKPSSSFVERYLGHFGVGKRTAAAKKSASAKKASTGKRNGPKKASSGVKQYRRAS